MPFTGKATFTAGADIPEVLEDVSDIIGMMCPSHMHGADPDGRM